MWSVGTRPSGSMAAASDPALISHGARTARASRAGDDIARGVPAAGWRARGGPRRARAGRDGRAVRRQQLARGPPDQIGGRHPGPQQRGDDRAGRRADEEVGPSGVPSELVVDGRQHTGMEGVADGRRRHRAPRRSWAPPWGHCGRPTPRTDVQPSPTDPELRDFLPQEVSTMTTIGARPGRCAAARRRHRRLPGRAGRRERGLPRGALAGAGRPCGDRRRARSARSPARAAPRRSTPRSTSVRSRRRRRRARRARHPSSSRDLGLAAPHPAAVRAGQLDRLGVARRLRPARGRTAVTHWLAGPLLERHGVTVSKAADLRRPALRHVLGPGQCVRCRVRRRPSRRRARRSCGRFATSCGRRRARCPCRRPPIGRTRDHVRRGRRRRGRRREWSRSSSRNMPPGGSAEHVKDDHSGIEGPVSMASSLDGLACDA